MSVAPMSFFVSNADEQPLEIFVDYFDLAARVAEREPDAHPLLRFALLIEMAASGVVDPDAPLDASTRIVDATLYFGAGSIDAERLRNSILEVRDEDRTAMSKLVEMCLLSEIDNCQESDLDLLLDDAETRHPRALMTLSLIHAFGFLVEEDADRAIGFYRRLRDGAEPDVATVTMVTSLAQMVRARTPNGVWLAELATDLRKSAAANYAPAQAALPLLRKIKAPEADTLDDPMATMERAFAGGYPPAGIAKAMQWASEADGRARAVERLKAVVEAGYSGPAVTYLLADNLRRMGRHSEAGRWLAMAARAGSPVAMTQYSARYFGGSEERATMGRELLRTAFALDYLPSLEMLIDSYVKQPAPQEEMAEVYNLLVAATEKTDLPGFHLALGKAETSGLGVKANMRRGLKSVRRAQSRGLAEAYLFEHQLIENGQLEAPRWKKRVRLLDKALATQRTPSIEAAVGRILYSHREASEADQGRGFGLMAAAEAAGQSSVLNDTAWLLCTRGGDAVRGLALAQRAVERSRQSTTLDTLAGCMAANGDFAKAVELQTEAVELVKNDPGFDDTWRAPMAQRLDNYRAGKADFAE